MWGGQATTAGQFVGRRGGTAATSPNKGTELLIDLKIIGMQSKNFGMLKKIWIFSEEVI